MKDYINKVGESIPNVLRIAQTKEVIKDKSSLILYGFFEDTGFKGFFKKIKQGIKARTNG
jgi:hypothetical protein|tara:strand:+ start:6667 stop:6846 length:180 start_codon:yes stop_codon:yes gene_type:complete